MSSYEDNTVGLDDRNEYQKILTLVRVDPNKDNNFDEIFPMIISKLANKDERPNNDRLTQQDLLKLDSFGTALARYMYQLHSHYIDYFYNIRLFFFFFFLFSFSVAVTENSWKHNVALRKSYQSIPII